MRDQRTCKQLACPHWEGGNDAGNHETLPLLYAFNLKELIHDQAKINGTLVSLYKTGCGCIQRIIDHHLLFEYWYESRRQSPVPSSSFLGSSSPFTNTAQWDPCPLSMVPFQVLTAASKQENLSKGTYKGPACK
jgi:hypothetical protein